MVAPDHCCALTYGLKFLWLLEVSHQKGAYGDEEGAEFPHHPSFLGSMEASELLCLKEPHQTFKCCYSL